MERVTPKIFCSLAPAFDVRNVSMGFDALPYNPLLRGLRIVIGIVLRVRVAPQCLVNPKQAVDFHKCFKGRLGAVVRLRFNPIPFVSLGNCALMALSKASSQSLHRALEPA
jgi:hypothetical protein